MAVKEKARLRGKDSGQPARGSPGIDRRQARPPVYSGAFRADSSPRALRAGA
jgi:hypothetical protein